MRVSIVNQLRTQIRFFLWESPNTYVIVNDSTRYVFFVVQNIYGVIPQRYRFRNIEFRFVRYELSGIQIIGRRLRINVILRVRNSRRSANGKKLYFYF